MGTFRLGLLLERAQSGRDPRMVSGLSQVSS